MNKSHFRKNSPEIIAFGEAMAMLVADETGALECVDHFHRRVAGADTNVAIGLARLGFHVGWLSRVGDDSFGRYLRKTLGDEGLDCQFLHTDPLHSTGLVFKARANHSEDPAVEYYRRNSAASQLCIEDAKGIDFSQLRHLHATGIPPALSSATCELSEYMMAKARNAGASISFDPNLRPSLWKNENVMRETLNALAVKADWVLPGLSEGRLLTGHERPEAIADFYLDRGARAVIIKLGPQGSYYRGVLNGQLESYTVEGIPVTRVLDTVGAGDGFAVGLISALLEGFTPSEALHRANLIGARAVQVIGDMEGLPNSDQLKDLTQHLI
ncbi:sugar kinase [Cobetia sp.]|uniref:sugar kinase n=1 Tax=Cobetia sp. TaxID=1873876 RepID=UPI00257E0FCB|nr:sugar kinase [Cobetia sp.]